MEKLLHLHQITTPEKTKFSPATVIKIGGNSQSSAGIADIALLARLGRLPIIVHGGGPQITSELQKRGIVSNMVNGVRVTDSPSLEVVNYVLSKINADIVAQLKDLGVNAKGYTADTGLLYAVTENPDLGLVGGVPVVDAAALMTDIQKGIVPVIAPLAMDINNEEGVLNINGDTAAGAIAARLKSNLLLVTDVPGVLDPTKSLIPDLTESMYEEMLMSGHITTGMVPKLQAAFAAKKAGGHVSICGSDQIVDAVLGKPIATKIIDETILFEDASAKETPTKKEGTIFVGTEIRDDLTETTKFHVALQIHAQLMEQEENMQVLSPQKLVEIMNKGNAVMRLGENNELLGFAQVSENPQVPEEIIVGTWLGIQHTDYTNGSGASVMKHAVELALTSMNFFGVEKVITRVKADNERPQDILVRVLGAKPEDPEISNVTGNLVNVYDVTHVWKKQL